ncbi:hypothetical protein L1049_023899 [Liquidambar formosana]|uniref:Uncharacterized protein n=1 Tax=Liquidambar formosana TaxID=63359 RepID=A0AAP0WZ37_LIQFO
MASEKRIFTAGLRSSMLILHSDRILLSVMGFQKFLNARMDIWYESINNVLNKKQIALVRVKLTPTDDDNLEIFIIGKVFIRSIMATGRNRDLFDLRFLYWAKSRARIHMLSLEETAELTQSRELSLKGGDLVALLSHKERNCLEAS